MAENGFQKLTIEQIEEIVKNGKCEWDDLFAIATLPQTPVHILKKLVEHKNTAVSYRAKKALRERAEKEKQQKNSQPP